jgi:hypothetical protein
MGTRKAVTFLYLGLLLSATITAAAQQKGGAGQVFQGPQIEEFLKTGKVATMKDLPEGVTLPKKATLELNGEKHFGVWKTIDEGPVPSKKLDSGVELQFQDSWRTEIAAYELDKLIGLGMVPATVPRTLEGKQGSMQFFVDSVMDVEGLLKKKIQPPNQALWNQQLAKIRLWDNLIYNTDRNQGNLLITSDWQIRVIDHSRTFRPFDELKNPKQLTMFSRTLLANLKKLDEPTLQEHLGKYLSPAQINGILKRRDAIIALSDKMVADQGSGAVLYQ